MKTIDYSTAKRLAKLNYSGEWDKLWNDGPDKWPPRLIQPISCCNLYEQYPAPYLEQVVEWLRKMHNIFVWVEPRYMQGYKMDDVKWAYKVQPLSNIRKQTFGRDFNTYDAALEMAINDALGLIEKGK